MKHVVRAALAFIAGLLVAAPPAAASRIVYECGWDLCSVRPDGGGKQRLTRDGRRTALYMSPSASRDGRHMVFLQRGILYRSDARARGIRRVGALGWSLTNLVIRPDGRELLFVEQLGGLCRTTLAGRRRRCASNGRNGHVWGPRNSLLGGSPGDRYELCREALDGRCLERIVDGGPPFLPQGGHAVSPDGRLVALEQSSPDLNTRGIVVYDLRRRRVVSRLSGGHFDTRPVFSPDGRWVAFWRYLRNFAPRENAQTLEARLYRAPARGGRPRPVVTTWVEFRIDAAPVSWVR